ncbi:unnamed protein product [Ranitomeya imitator]|uniref:TAFH domain-containing protein n=1 Tax=Ranitomeya imitator TaxID=111125 RepID=A0ABN9M7K4_9NEOB|nr:unnamed protein product [Ranitomeya imitator]
MSDSVQLQSITEQIKIIRGEEESSWLEPALGALEFSRELSKTQCKNNPSGKFYNTVITMPDSPADVKTQTRTTPPNMPPPSPALSQGANRNSSFTPSTMMNGSSHSPTAINGAPSTPNGFSNGPSASSSAALTNQQLPPACGARQLSKLKRFLTTLQQFGSDISPEIGERVRALVLGLVNSTLTIEEFHSKLQEATNFPLRPFVWPIEAFIGYPIIKRPIYVLTSQLQRELLHCARLAKQSPAQYLAQHEQLLLDTSVSSSPSDSSEILLEVNENGKRRTPDRNIDCLQIDGGPGTEIPIVYSIFSVVYSIFSVVYSIFSVVYSIFSVVYSIFSVVYSVFSVVYSVFSVVYSVFSVVYSIFSVVYSIFSVVYFIFSVVYSIISVVYSIFSVVYSISSVVYSIFSVIYSIFSVVF